MNKEVTVNSVTKRAHCDTIITAGRTKLYFNASDEIANQIKEGDKIFLGGFGEVRTPYGNTFEEH